MGLSPKAIEQLRSSVINPPPQKVSLYLPLRRHLRRFVSHVCGSGIP